MAFDLENGYQPRTFEEILEDIVEEINTQFGTSYDTETIVGTEFYKFFYAGIQLVMQAESYTAQIVAEMTDYIRTSNEKINLPKSTINGFIAGLKDSEENGGLALDSTIKNIVDSDEAGYMFCCVDANDGEHAKGEITITNYANLVSGDDDEITIGATTFVAQTGAVTEGDATFQASISNQATAESLADQINAHAVAKTVVRAIAIGSVVKLRAIHGGIAGNSIALSYTDNDSNVGASVSGANLTGGNDNEDYANLKAEIITRMHNWLTAGLYYQGTETGTKTAINGQTFNYAYYLPTPIDILVRITVQPSLNSLSPVLNENQIRDIFNANFSNLYKLGLNFEPEKYLEISRDLPFASDILLEYSEDDESTWSSEPRIMAYNEKINIVDSATIIIE